ncbi:hypothetical protein ABIE51_002164 [Lysobacter sp. OAE881]|uniref:hypothetical protein n=1 Tax=Lysobacter sp. OAE881 TaxID=2663813 RepID=UPI001789BAFE
MEVLFRFNLVRDAAPTTDDVAPIDLATRSRFQTDAAAIPAGDARRKALHDLAHAFIASNAYRDPSESPTLAPLLAVDAAIERLLASGSTTRTKVANALEAALGQSPDAWLATADVEAAISSLKDSIVAIKLSPADHARPILKLVAALRAHALIERFVADDTFPSDASALRAALRRGLRLPDAVPPSRGPPQTPPPAPGAGDRLKDLAARHERLTAAIAELRQVRPDGYATVPQREMPGRLPPEKFRPTQLFQHEFEIRNVALKSTVFASGAAVTGAAPAARETPPSGLSLLVSTTAAAPFLKSEALLWDKPGVGVGRGARIALTGRPEFQPVMPGLLGLRLNEATQQNLSEPTRKVLAEFGMKPADPLARTLDRLSQEQRLAHEAAQALMRPVAQKTFRRVGSTSIAVTSTPDTAMYCLAPGALLDLFGGAGNVPASVPATHADIKPSGIMDLLLVRQQLKGYESAEVSHIANVLKGEKSERVHRTRLETETITFTEAERTVETLTELQTTDRFEIRRESEIALQEETAVKGSLSVKGKYGPSVEFQATGEASWNRRSQESERAASEVAREVTQKASEKVTERVLRRETLRVNRQVEESNLHSFDNSVGAAAHVSGIYQWVTKVYEAQVFNYGPRTVYDIMVPEPAALLLESFRRRRTAAVELDKPADFNLRPADLNEANYQTWIALYGATDVKPPPEPYVMESYDFNTGGEDEDQEFTNSTRIKIPDGYRAVRATVGQVSAVWDDWCVDVVIGQRSHRFAGGAWVWPTALDEETAAVPFALVTDKVGDIAVAVEVICESTERAVDLWRADTHAKLYNAYTARLSEYEARLAELEAQAPAEIVSGPGARNHALMIDEVKRACISILTEQHFDLFGAIGSDAQALPTLDFAEARTEGAYARFFEQAFEWENLSWVPYGYFWARKSTWLDRIAIEDDDADFQAFLKAGYLRVQIPVRPGFAEALDHFRKTGDLWGGGALPAISDDLYLPIATEIAEKLGRPGDEVPVGDPWEVRVPTSLVKLRPDDKLPTWTKQADGTWLPG